LKTRITGFFVLCFDNNRQKVMAKPKRPIRMPPKVHPSVVHPIPSKVADANPRSRPKVLPLVVGGVLLYFGATYTTMLVYKSKKDTQKDIERQASGEENSELTPRNFDTSTIWNKIAGDYDKEIATDEFWMGIGLLRRWLIGNAKVTGLQT
jgi:hypothetical protein